MSRQRCQPASIGPTRATESLSSIPGVPAGRLLRLLLLVPAVLAAAVAAGARNSETASGSLTRWCLGAPWPPPAEGKPLMEPLSSGTFSVITSHGLYNDLLHHFSWERVLIDCRRRETGKPLLHWCTTSLLGASKSMIPSSQHRPAVQHTSKAVPRTELEHGRNTLLLPKGIFLAPDLLHLPLLFSYL